MAYVFALNNGYTSRENGWQTYHLVPSEAPMPPRPVTPPTPSEWIPGTVLERDPEPPVRRPWTPEPVVEPHNQQNEDTGFLIEDPKYHLGFIGEEPRLIRRSPSYSAQNSAASEAVPQATLPTWSYRSVSSDPGSEDEG
ncbi:hypothetical protein KC361_g755 [Hortaea werneckii]|nr:hypothetical protein KC361_g755 [Hortaea werneckii]KAI7510372.1 hypothetical protein KC347_g4374 [Hortaea werneckii]